MPLVTLLTYFGTADAYVAEMKAAMLGIDPTIRFVDITHDLSLGDVSSATYLLARSWQRFSKGTVHLVVGALLAFVGSNGTVEIAVRDGSAALALDVRAGVPVTLTPAPSEPDHHR